MRAVSAAFQAAVESGVVYPLRLVELEFDSVTLNLCTLPYPITWDSKSWEPIDGSSLVGMGRINETQNTEALSFDVELAGESSGMIALTLAGLKPNGHCKVYFAVMNAARQLIADPDLRYVGILDQQSINDAGAQESRVTCDYTSRLADLQQPNERRYSTEQQQFFYGTDLGFGFLNQLNDGVDDYWGNKKKRRKKKGKRRGN